MWLVINELSSMTVILILSLFHLQPNALRLRQRCFLRLNEMSCFCSGHCSLSFCQYPLRFNILTVIFSQQAMSDHSTRGYMQRSFGLEIMAAFLSRDVFFVFVRIILFIFTDVFPFIILRSNLHLVSGSKIIEIRYLKLFKFILIRNSHMSLFKHVSSDSLQAFTLV